MYFGACYYPEHWPEERWATDVRMMKEAGFNVVRMAEFAWGSMEPRDGEFDFGWLDRAMNLMAENDIKVILGTPTAGPPKWLLDKHPDIYQKDIYGHVRGFGTRKHCCSNNKNFHKHTEQIVTAMATRYGQNENVIGWQIDNEFGIIDTTRCYCESCLEAFKVWLQKHYKSIDELNEAWGTVFSSQTYLDWDAIHLPTFAVHQNHNLGLALDFRRFSSDSVVAYQKIQLDLLRQHTTNQLITTNQMGKFNTIDYYNLAEELDLSSLDVYPIMKTGKKERPSYAAFQHDVTRGFKLKNFWVLEHQSGTPGAVVLAPTPKPGELRRWTYQSIAHGADGIVYFRWRTIPYALEEYWHGILQHHGEPGRKYDEVKQVGSEIKTLAPVLENTEPRAKVGLIRSFDNEWVFEIQPHVRGYEYMKHFEKYYRYFFDRNITVEVISPDADFSRYDVLVAPNLTMAQDETVKQLYAFVERGGCLLMDFRSGAKLWNNQITQKRLPGKFRELLGIGIEDYGIIDDEHPNAMRFVDSDQESNVQVWYDVIDLIEAEPVAVFTSNYFEGSPAMTRRSYGKGYAYYVGTEPDQDGIGLVLDHICQQAGIKPLIDGLPEGVEAIERVDPSNEERGVIVLINHNEQTETVTLDKSYYDYLSDTRLEENVVMAPQAVYVLKK